jgi:hypothetical protein
MIKNLLWSLLGKKYLLGGFVSLYRAATGYKTQIVAVLTAVTYALKVFGYIPTELADQLLLLLSGAGGVTLVQKFKRWDDEFKLTERVGELKKEAFEQLSKDGVITAAVDKNDAIRG